MTNNDVLAILKKSGGYLTDTHVVLTSGKHSNSYMNKDAVYPHTKDISVICEEMAKSYKDKNIQVVAAPALGGIILSQWTAHYLSELTKKEVLGVYTEKTPDKNQIFTRGYDKLVKGKRVLIVEDITTTGGSVMKVVDSVRNAGGIVVGLCVMVNRNPDEINEKALGLPYHALCEVRVPAWLELDCPLCKKGIPINISVGKGREYLAKKGIKN
jgi:orotate phosphoribosyltransferase